MLTVRPMLNNLDKPYPFFDDLWYNLRVITGISLGMFLFILFFQPVYLSGFDFNTQLMIIAGYGAIALLVLSLNNIILPSIFPGFFLKGHWKLYMDILLQLISWSMLAVAYNFYTRYVGQVLLNFDTSFRIILIGLFPVVILIIFNRFKILRLNTQKLEEIIETAGIMPEKIRPDPEITFDSENKSETLAMKLSEFLFIRSANNYIEIYWLADESAKKMLLRSTLKRAEEILQPHHRVLRCHRTILVNSEHIIRFTGIPGNLKLKLHSTDEEIPVSRQYLQAVKDALKVRRGK